VFNIIDFLLLKNFNKNIFIYIIISNQKEITKDTQNPLKIINNKIFNVLNLSYFRICKNNFNLPEMKIVKILKQLTYLITIYIKSYMFYFM
jgi:hypothetical protein